MNMIELADTFISNADDSVKVVSIKNQDIVTDRMLRKYCEQNSCGYYNKNWMCPPGVGNIDDLIEKIRSCGDGILIQSVLRIKDSFDLEGMETAGKKHKQSFMSLLHSIEQQRDRSTLLPLNVGNCDLCKECSYIQNKPCRFPDKALASVESHGIDVGKTLKNVGLTYINGANTLSYVGIILDKKE